MEAAPDSSPAESAPRRARRGDPRLAIGLAGSLLLVGFACRALLRFQPATNLVVLSGQVEEFFFEPSDSSPLVVMGLSGWLVWRRRRRLARLWGAHAPILGTLAWFALAVGIFGWSVVADVPELQAVALVPALLGATHVLCGRAGLRVVALPAAVLLFAVPIPAPLMNWILWKLQIWTASFTELLIGGLGFDVLRSGDLLIMTDGLFQIIETCSGARSIETLGMLSVLMIELFGRRGRHALTLLVLSPFVAFLINGLRCVGLIFNPHADISSIHNLQGVAMLLGGVLLLYFLDGALEKVFRSPTPLSAWERAVRSGPASRAPLAPRVATVFAFSVCLLAVSFLPASEPVVPRAKRATEVLPLELGPWRGQDQKIDWLFLGKAKFAQTLHRRYSAGADAVDVFLGQADPSTRVRSYLSPKAAYPGAGWLTESESRGQIAGREVTLRVLRKGANRRLVAHWFEGSPGLGTETARALIGRFPADALPIAVRLSTDLPSAQDDARLRARARIEYFAGLILPALDDLIRPLPPASTVSPTVSRENTDSARLPSRV